MHDRIHFCLFILVWEDEESEWSACPPAVTVGHAVSVGYPRGRGGYVGPSVGSVLTICLDRFYWNLTQLDACHGHIPPTSLCPQYLNYHIHFALQYWIQRWAWCFWKSPTSENCKNKAFGNSCYNLPTVADFVATLHSYLLWTFLE